jgi:PilZ domain
MADSKVERRSGRRIQADIPLSIKLPQGELEAIGRSRDLSESGIFFYTDAQIGEGSELEMVLILPPELTQGEKRWVCCQASVVRLEERNGGGEVGVAAVIKNLQVLPGQVG